MKLYLRQAIWRDVFRHWLYIWKSLGLGRVTPLYAAKLASKFVKVVLSGAGGDELFAGYPWRYFRTMVNDNFEDYIDKYYLYWQRLVSNSDLKQLFSPFGMMLKMYGQEIYLGMYFYS